MGRNRRLEVRNERKRRMEDDDDETNRGMEKRGEEWRKESNV
jgi:hypothetical protein